MKDGRFIQEMLQSAQEAGEKVKTELGSVSSAQLNWKPAEESWSIGQCLDHLIISDCLYFPAFEKITESKYEMSVWENWSPLSGLFGKVLTTQIREYSKKRLRAPKIFMPSYNTIDMGLFERFYKHLDSLRGHIAGCNTVDIDKVYITSPISKLVTLSLRKTILLLVQHEHRHINQAIKVKETKDFPEQ